MGRVRPLRALLAIVVLVTVGLAAAAAYLWWKGNEAGSLALLTAVATFALAIAAILTIDQNRALVASAIAQARAASDEAQASRETVEEMQRQRDLAYRPYLVISRDLQSDEGKGSGHRYPIIRVLNIGAGPAVNVALSGVREPTTNRPDREWLASDIQGIQPGGTWIVLEMFVSPAQSVAGARRDRYRCITDDLAQEANDGEVVAVRYEDLFGNHYRSSPDVRRAHRPEEWKGLVTTIDTPDWLRCQG